MSLSKIKKDLKSLVVKDLGRALERFESILNSDARLYNDIILQQSSFNGLKRERNQGIISDSNATMRQNRIRYAVLEMVDMIEDEDIDMEAPVLKPKEEEVIDSSNVISNSKVYISYAWKGNKEGSADLEKIVNKLDKELKDKGLIINRDKRNLDYGESIKIFMEAIGNGDKIIVVVSDKYLKSENCMFELMQIYENNNFSSRIFPIVLDDANIYSVDGRLDYIDYWNERIEKLDMRLRKTKGRHLNKLHKEVDMYSDIRDSFDAMADVLKDKNAWTPEMHEKDNFQKLYEKLIES